MKIAIDYDGTIYETEKNFRVQAELYDIEKIHGQGMKDKYALWAEDRYDWTEEQNKNFLLTFPKITEDSNLMPGAKEVITRFKKLGVKLILLSARGGNRPETKDEDASAMIKTAMDKLKKDGIVLDKYIFGTEGKVDECQEEKIDFMIDDSPEVCKETSEAGIKTIFLRDSGVYGIEPNDYLYEVNNWGEIYRIILDYLNKENKK